MKTKLAPQEKARNYAFLLLKFRLRSEQEIEQRLKKKKFQEPIIKNTLDFLKDKGFIDDELFAKEWIQWRIKRQLGLLRIKEELKFKGISKVIIDKLLGEVRQAYPEEQIISRIASEKFKKLKGIEVNKAKQRIYGYFLRRGFSPSIVIDVVRQL